MFTGANVTERKVVIFYCKIQDPAMPSPGMVGAGVLIGRKCDTLCLICIGSHPGPWVINEDTQYWCSVLPENGKI